MSFRRSIASTLAAFWLAWVMFIIPLHQRGIVQMPGCPMCAQARQQTGGPCPGTAPMNAKNCAVCNLVMKIDTGVTFTIIIPALGRAEIVAPPAPLQPTAAEVWQLFRSRAPPVTA